MRINIIEQQNTYEIQQKMKNEYNYNYTFSIQTLKQIIS